MDVGETAPEFTAPLARGDIEPMTLSEHLDRAPIVLAFFPGAFTEVCTDELSAFEQRLGEFDALGATVYGVSVDMPYALNEFRRQAGLSVGLISDTNRRLVERYDVTTDFVSIGVDDLAKRAVFVVDDERTIRYAWETDDPGIEPDYDAILDAVATVGQA